MREKAARMGCDGLVLLGANDRMQSPFPGNVVSTLRGYRSTCIVYADPGTESVTTGSTKPL